MFPSRFTPKLVLGVRSRLNDLVHSPFRGLGWHSPFGLVLLRLLGFPIPMLFAVCHDLVLRYPVTLSSDGRRGSPRLLRQPYCFGAFAGVLPGVLTLCGGGLVLPAAPARLASLL